MATLTQVKHIGRTNAKQYDYEDGVSILVSYSTPVALTWPDEQRRYRVTDRYHSQTTQRHIKKWVGTGERVPIEQERLTHEFYRRGGLQ